MRPGAAPVRIASLVIDGRHTYGLAGEDCLYPVDEAFHARYPTLRDALAAGAAWSIPDHLTGPREWREARLLVPIPNPDKIICVGKNYAAHAAETGDRPAAYPNLFLRLTNTLVACGDAVLLPQRSIQFDYEGELAVIIGKPGRHIAPERALEHVAGYSCFMDGSVRDVQFGQSLTAGKNFPMTGGFGPWLTLRSVAEDPSAFEIRTRVNGTEMQAAGIGEMIFSVQELVAYASGITPLVAGDIIATGTPDGVGFARKPQVWLKAGDVVEVEIPGVGCLRNPVEAE
jgi:2-keto-4-pentenoate hydratase/2-oxohepta-3-ene-1,7-dioic acid hydratase in catechol pathway